MRLVQHINVRLAVGSGGVTEAPSPASKAGKLAQAASSSHKVTSFFLAASFSLLLCTPNDVVVLLVKLDCPFRSPSISLSVVLRGNQRESC